MTYSPFDEEAALYIIRRNRGKNLMIEVLGEDYDGFNTQDFYPSFDGAPRTGEGVC
jgi:hypothetical protein